MGIRTHSKKSFYACSLIDKNDKNYKDFIKQPGNQSLELFFKFDKRNEVTEKYEFDSYGSEFYGVLHTIKESSFTSKQGDYFDMLTFTFYDKEENSYITFRLFKDSVFAKTLVSRLVNLTYQENKVVEVSCFEIETKDGKKYLNAIVKLNGKNLNQKTPRDISNAEKDEYYRKFLGMLMENYGKHEETYTKEDEILAMGSNVSESESSNIKDDLKDEDDIPF